MNDIRRYMALVENEVTEVYSRDNAELLRYMQKKEFDPYNHWFDVSRWLVRNGYLEEISAIVGEEIEDVDDLTDNYDADLFFKLPVNIQKQCADDVVDELMQIDAADAPTWAHLDAERMLHRQTWLVHFSDHAHQISHAGFTIGVDQMDKLGLTTHLGDYAKREGGYNFAFEATSRDALHAARGRQGLPKYGKHAVMFQNAGVRAYHYGDEETQIIFHGKDVDPKNIILIVNDDNTGKWSVSAREHGKRGQREYVYASEKFENVVKWVIANHAQYRGVITRA
jgi:hypothetical protein